jgi:predicted ATP-dependent protease
MGYRKYSEYHKMIDGVEYKQCQDCLEWHIMDLNNFGLVSKNKDGFNHRCKTCQVIKNESYYNQTRDKQIESAKKRQQEHREELLIYKKKHYKNNISKYKEQHYEYRTKNKDYYRNKRQNWQKDNPEKVKLYNEKRRNKIHNISEKQWDNCKFYFNHRCAYCGLLIEEHFILRKGQLKWIDFHKEHVIDQGRNDIKNCIPSCQTCNSEKNTKTFNEWYNKNNLKYSLDRYMRIYKWIRYDCKNLSQY